MGKELTEQRTLEREMQVWRLRVQGFSQTEVAEKLDLTQSGISRILDRCAKRLEREFVEEVRAYKILQTEQLEQVYRRAIEQFEVSCQDSTTRTETTGKETGGSDDKSKAQIVKTVAGQSGNPGFLAQARGALSDIREVWGISAPVRKEVSGPEGGPLEYRAAGYHLDGKIAGIVAALASGEAAGDPDPGGEG